MNKEIVKTCRTCAHRNYNRCMLSVFYCETERKLPDVCKVDFSGWVQREPRIGIFPRLFSFFFNKKK